MIVLMLQMLGAQAVAAITVRDALLALERELPDVIVSDINMPDEDGYDLIRILRTLPPSKGGLVPAIALTAMTDEEDRARALTSGFQAHLPKPVDPDVLVSVICGLRAPRIEDVESSSQ
jgi:CheY-like chemotaxis protein